MIALIFSVVALLFIVSALALATKTAADIRKANTAKRLETLRTGQSRSVTAAPEGVSILSQQEDPYINIIPRQWRPNLKRVLDSAGDAISLRVLALIALLGGIIIAYLADYLVNLSIIPKLLVGIVGGVITAIYFLRSAQAKMKAKFLALFPDSIDLVVRAVRAGLPISAALDAVGREVADPAGKEFRLLMADMKIGMTFEEAMRRASQRVNLLEFSFFTASLILQRETGGNLSETLETLGMVLRRRQEMVLKANTLTSEARTSTYVMIALPFFVSGALALVNPSYLAVYSTNPKGHYVLLAAAVMLLLGYGSMRVLMAQALK